MNEEIAKEWLLSALADLKSIQHIIADVFLTHMVAFHGQQCVEKCFKAVLEYNGKNVPKFHSTLKLYGLIKSELPLDVDTDILSDFDDLYINARYPGEFGLLPYGKPSLEHAQEFYNVSLHIFNETCTELGIEVQDR